MRYQGIVVDYDVVILESVYLRYLNPLTDYRKGRIYLDEYPEQEEIRKRYFLLRHHYKTNWIHCKEVLEKERRLMYD